MPLVSHCRDCWRVIVAWRWYHLMSSAVWHQRWECVCASDDKRRSCAVLTKIKMTGSKQTFKWQTGWCLGELFLNFLIWNLFSHQLPGFSWNLSSPKTFINQCAVHHDSANAFTKMAGVFESWIPPPPPGWCPASPAVPWCWLMLSFVREWVRGSSDIYSLSTCFCKKDTKGILFFK